MSRASVWGRAAGQVGQAEGAEGPGTLVGWLFLQPADVCDIRVYLQDAFEVAVRDWVELFDSDDRAVGDALRAEVGIEFAEEFAAGEQDPPGRRWLASTGSKRPAYSTTNPPAAI